MKSLYKKKPLYSSGPLPFLALRRFDPTVLFLAAVVTAVKGQPRFDSPARQTGIVNLLHQNPVAGAHHLPAFAVFALARLVEIAPVGVS